MGSEAQVHTGASDGVRLTEWANPAPDLLYMCEFIYIHLLSGAHILAVPSVLGLLLNTEPIQDPDQVPGFICPHKAAS